MARCRDHCPTRGHGSPWLLDLLAALAVLAAVYWTIGKAAPVVDSVMSRAAVVAVVATGVAAVLVVAKLAVDRVRSRRALARYAELEREAWTAQVVAEPRALTEAARALEQAPTLRVEAFVERHDERDVA